MHKAYSKEGVPTKALNGITFDVLNGEYLGIMGASGSGKTTLLNCIATVIKPTSGQILLSGANISSFDGTKLAEYRGNKIGYLFQDFALLDNLTGKENIILPLSIHNIDIVTAEKKLKDIADFLGITDVLSKFPSQMSGGQKQRVAAARSLISDPDIILADEPTGALDTKSARLLMEKLQEINLRRGRTILMVTHDPNAASFCSRILFIQDGVIFHEFSSIGESRATTTTPGNKCSGLWATTRTKGRQAFIAIVRALKASQALGRAALTGRGGTPARLC